MAEVTFPQLIQRACGIDVHLKVVVATIDGVGIPLIQNLHEFFE